MLNQVEEDSDRIVPAEFIKHLNIFGASLNIISHYDFRGPSSAYASCAGGSISEGFNAILNDEADVMIVGASDNGIHSYILKSFSKLGLLNKMNNDTPESALKPFDDERDGTVLSDGCGVLILEEHSHALNRKAKIYAEVVGGSLDIVSYNQNISDLEENGIYRNMRNVIRRAGIKNEDIDLIHSCGSSSMEEDNIEAIAISECFKEPGPAIMGISSNLGYMMAGTGGIQSVGLILAIKYGIIPPILNLKRLLTIHERVLDYVTEKRNKEIKYGISNHSEIRGINCSLLYKKYE